MANLEGFRDFVRADEEDRTLELYLDAAIEKAKTAGVEEREGNAHYDLFVYSLAALWYDNRSFDWDGDVVQKMINAFVLELR